jgi:hypothetical protein
MVKPMILGVVVFVVTALIAAPAALGQSAGGGAPSAVIDNNGVAKANAGGTSAVAGCPTQPPEATAGGVVAKAPCKPAPLPPPPAAPKAAPPAPAPPPAPVQAKAAPAPPPPAPAPAPAPKALPPTGGASMASLVGLVAGTLLVGGGLLFRRFAR